LNDEKSTIIRQRSLLNEVFWTVVILIIFAFVLIVLMIVGLLLYKRISLINKKKFLIDHHKEQHEKHEPFPGDDAYDNLKTSAHGSTTDSGTTTDV